MGKDKSKKKSKKKKSPIKVVLEYLAMIGFDVSVLLGGVGFVYNNFISIPDLKYEKQENRELFTCDQELKDAVIHVHPQILMTKDEHIIRMINLEEFCEESVLHYQQEQKGFEFAGTDWDEALVCCSEIKERLEEPQEDICLEKAYLLKMEYKKRYGDRHTKYYIVEDGKTPYRVSEDVIIKRGQDVDLSLDNLEMDIEQIAADCDLILKTL